MIGNSPFYFGSVRKVVTAFGALFNDIHIQRKDSLGSVVKTIEVPLTYAPKHRFFQAVEYGTEDDNSSRVNIVLPRMAYEITTMFYDSQRKINTVQQKRFDSVDGSKGYKYSPVPYNITFSLYIAVKNTEDGLQIIEQIVPFFQPHFTVSIFELDQPGISRDVPFVLQSVDFEDTYDGDIRSERTIIWTLTFQASAYLYGPTLEAKEIKSAQVELAVNGEFEIVQVDVNPGTANEDDPWTPEVTVV